METWQREFIDFMVRSEVLIFGDFTTKSGRKTPYFVNTGAYRTGDQIARLAETYARTIVARIEDGTISEFDFLFGPAYKGIPLATATALVLARDHGTNVGYCFDRKEEKDHGEGGKLVGWKPADGDRVLLIEDVTTAGTSIRQSAPMLRRVAGVELGGLIVSVDRQERGQADSSALDELATEFSMPTFAIVTIDQIVEHLREHAVDGKRILDEAALGRIQAYREEWGARPQASS
ncbi:MAG: orotate phosphoribosyltransferase [Planctomycetota bacterium]|jgi:orotate phosphoribosyltransferase